MDTFITTESNCRRELRSKHKRLTTRKKTGFRLKTANHKNVTPPQHLDPLAPPHHRAYWAVGAVNHSTLATAAAAAAAASLTRIFNCDGLSVKN